MKEGTRAKFYVSGVELQPGTQGVKVNLQAVSRGDRNASWSTATPSGSMQMTINNPPAAEWWENFMRASRATGRSPEVFIDIYPATDGWPGDGHAFRAGEGKEGTIYGPANCGECGCPKDATINHPDGTSDPVHPNG